MTITRYRKQPVVIEAAQLTLDTADEIRLWAGEHGVHVAWTWGPERRGLTIPTLEGDMHADMGDWVIRGVKGEFYPCKPDVFAESYEQVA